ncbi:MAG: CBS domain-containing protein [Caldilineaceae bacterium]|nr:CBS domain-containing protein [Caldilineaceae bacterium]
MKQVIKQMTVLQAKRFGVYTCHPDDTLQMAARHMQHHNISSLVVTDADGFLAGVITRTDLVRACYRQPEWDVQPVRDFMNEDVVTVLLDDPLERVLELLIDRHIHRVVAVEVLGERQRPVAVLSAADIVYHMAKDR